MNGRTEMIEMYFQLTVNAVVDLPAGGSGRGGVQTAGQAASPAWSSRSDRSG